MIVTLDKANPIPEGWTKSTMDRLMPLPPDCTYLILNYREGFVFDEERARKLSGKRWVIIDYSEYGCNHSWQNKHLYGLTIAEHRQTMEIAEILRLDDFLRRENILLYLKREFSKNISDMIDAGQVHFPVEPIEIFFDNLPPIPPLNREEYMDRIGLIFHLFGNSHHDRKRLAAALMERQERICTSIGKMTDLINARLPFSLVEQIEHISRYVVGDVCHWQSKCLMSVNAFGFGCKNFRNREACHSAVPIIPDIGMNYAIPWTDDNAVMLPTKDGKLLIPESMDKLEAVLRDRENLWHRMQNAHDVAHALQPEPYVRDQVNAKIQKYL